MLKWDILVVLVIVRLKVGHGQNNVKLIRYQYHIGLLTRKLIEHPPAHITDFQGVRATHVCEMHRLKVDGQKRTG